MYFEIAKFSRYMLYVAIIGTLGSEEVPSDCTRMPYPDTLIGTCQKIFPEAYQRDLNTEPLCHMCHTCLEVLLKALSIQDVLSLTSSLESKQRLTDTSSLNSATLFTELLLVILVVVYALPAEHHQPIVLSYLNGIRGHIKISTDHLELVMLIYKSLDNQSDSVSVYRYHVSFSIFFLLISDGGILKGVSTSSGIQELSHKLGSTLVDRELDRSAGFYQMVTMTWIDVLQYLSVHYDALGAEHSAYKMAIAEELPVTCEATSSFALAELLSVYDLLNDLPERKKLVLYIFLITLCARSRGRLWSRCA